MNGLTDLPQTLWNTVKHGNVLWLKSSELSELTFIGKPEFPGKPDFPRGIEDDIPYF